MTKIMGNNIYAQDLGKTPHPTGSLITLSHYEYQSIDFVGWVSMMSLTNLVL